MSYSEVKQAPTTITPLRCKIQFLNVIAVTCYATYIFSYLFRAADNLLSAFRVFMCQDDTRMTTSNVYGKFMQVLAKLFCTWNKSLSTLHFFFIFG